MNNGVLSLDESRWLRVLLVMAVVFHLVLLWIGFDRIPLLPIVGDGALIQDAPLALAAGQGLVSPSFEGTLRFESLYAHHPPLYLFLQALLFKAFGLSVWTLRGSSLVFSTVAAILVLLSFRKMAGLGLLHPKLLAPLFLVALFEPLGWYLGRWERMDTLVQALGAGSYLLLLAAIGAHTSRRRWVFLLLSALCAGLALSTHAGAAIVCVFLGILILGYRSRFGWSGLLAWGAIPLLIAVALWGLAFRGESLDAFRQFRVIASHLAGGWSGLVSSVTSSRLAPQEIVALAPVATFLVVGSLLVGAFAAWRDPVARTFWVALAAATLFVVAVAGDTRRFVLLAPFAVAVLGVVLRHASPRLRSGTGAALITVALASLALIGGYLLKGLREWDSRDPQRYAALVQSVPRETRVLTVPDLWYEFMKQGRTVRIADFGFPEDAAYWKAHPEKVAEYDVAILPEDNPLVPLMAGREFQSIDIGGKRFRIYSKTRR